MCVYLYILHINILHYKMQPDHFSISTLTTQFDQSPLMFKRRYLTEGSDFIYYYREFARKV